jgi:hypothetical protein
VIAMAVTAPGRRSRIETKASTLSPAGDTLSSPQSAAKVIRMKKWLPVLVLVCTPALALGQSLRCAEKIVSEGSTSQDVARLCGDPAQVEHKTVYNDVSSAASNVRTGATIEIHLEMWIYNFGPNRLMQRIWIQDGVVTRIESLGRYGY